MATIVISAALREALTKWNVEQVGRIPRGRDFRKVDEYHYEVEVDDQVAERIQAMRAHDNESAEDVLWRVIGHPGTARPQ